ncbi:MAG: M23 family metallopeptidase [Clostridia bacterium]
MNNLLTEINQFFARRAKILCPCVFLGLMVPTLSFTSELVKPNISVIINGEYVGMVETQQEFEEQMYAVEKTTSQVLSKPYKLNIEVEYVCSYGSYTNDLLSEEQANYILAEYVTGISTIAEIRVDGQVIGTLPSVAVANELLDEILLEAVGMDSESGASFVQDVQVVEVVSTQVKLEDEETIKKYFTSTSVGPSVHTVSANQTLSQIANSYGMKTDEIMNLNPDIEPTRMSIGQDILIEKAQPAVSVSVTKIETYTESIAYETETKYDDSMTTTQKKVDVPGVLGVEEFVAEITYVDDIPVEKIILSQTVLSEPETEVVIVGTLKPVTTGNFIMPTTGTLTSPYGYRSSGFHAGIDIAAPVGTPMYASDGGTVTYSGWYGGYGYCIIINHGNGFETLYGHASALYVSVGQKVSQGDLIAGMGSTGNSTGSHLHFEIRVNGVHQNPYNYL